MWQRVNVACCVVVTKGLSWGRSPGPQAIPSVLTASRRWCSATTLPSFNPSSSIPCGAGFSGRDGVVKADSASDSVEARGPSAHGRRRRAWSGAEGAGGPGVVVRCRKGLVAVILPKDSELAHGLRCKRTDRLTPAPQWKILCSGEAALYRASAVSTLEFPVRAFVVQGLESTCSFCAANNTYILGISHACS